MSRSLAREETTRTRDGLTSCGTCHDRASTQPVAALVAVVTICLALSSFAIGLEGALRSADRDPGVATPTLDRVIETLRIGGVVEPANVPDGPAAGPDGYEVNVTVTVGNRTWQAGRTVPQSSETATAPVSVRVGPGSVVPGRIRVEVWP